MTFQEVLALQAVREFPVVIIHYDFAPMSGIIPKDLIQQRRPGTKRPTISQGMMAGILKRAGSDDNYDLIVKGWLILCTGNWGRYCEKATYCDYRA
jgi:hypothetical protein